MFSLLRRLSGSLIQNAGSLGSGLPVRVRAARSATSTLA
jgi:hypothetical protein